MKYFIYDYYYNDNVYKIIVKKTIFNEYKEYATGLILPTTFLRRSIINNSITPEGNGLGLFLIDEDNDGVIMTPRYLGISPTEEQLEHYNNMYKDNINFTNLISNIIKPVNNKTLARTR